MAEYCIYTICTKNFRDCFDFSINSWLNNTIAEKIYIYTDDNTWVSKDSRIEIILLFDKCEDWLTSVNYKVIASKDVLRKPFEKFVFMDMDCYLLDDLGHVFNQKFDFAVTRLNDPHPDVRVSTGVFFFKNTEKTYQFFIWWEELQKNVWGKEKACSQSQNAFSVLIRKYHKTGEYKVLNLDVDVYNRKITSKWITSIKEDLIQDKIKVLHFYNDAFRDQKCVKELFGRYI